MTDTSFETRFDKIERDARSDAQYAEEKIRSLEEIRDEHQRQLLELGGLFSQMQHTMLTLTSTIGSQQRTISMLITEYERNIGDIANLPEQPAPADELAAKRDTES